MRFTSKVAVVGCNDYSLSKDALKKSLDLLGGINCFVKEGHKVLIKPNLCDPLPPEKAATTHPSIIKAIIELVHEAGGVAIVGECPGGNDPQIAKKVFEISGIKRVVEETGAFLRNFQEEPFITKNIKKYKVLEKTDFAKAIFDVDVIINVPKLKTHGITFMTGAVKNCFGCVRPSERQYLHGKFSKMEAFVNGLVDIYSVVAPSLTIMDAVVAMEGDEGPSYGDPKKVGVLLASCDGIAVDAVASEIVGYVPLAIPTSKEAAKRNLGVADLTNITIVGVELKNVKVDDFKKSSLFEQYNPYKKTKNTGEEFKLNPIVDKEKCTKCGHCVNNCPVGAITMDPYPVIDREKCILCYCCHELCPEGAYKLERTLKEEKKGTDLIRVGLTCNQNCLFCTVAEDKGNDLTTDEIKEKLDFLVKNKSEKIAFTGGEPTLRNDLPEIIKYAKQKGMKQVEIQTNGTKLSDSKYVEKLKKAGLSLALVALHSHKKDISERITQSQDSFFKTIKAIKNLQDQQIDVMISHVINTENYKHLLGFVKFVQDTFCKTPIIYFSFVRPNGNAFKNNWIVPRLSDIEPFIYETFSYCVANNIGFCVEGIPICYMYEFQKNNVELQRQDINPVFHWTLNELREDTHKKHVLENKVKSKRCVFCGLNSKCSGVWREYAKLKGTSELYPVW